MKFFNSLNKIYNLVMDIPENRDQNENNIMESNTKQLEGFNDDPLKPK